MLSNKGIGNVIGSHNTLNLWVNQQGNRMVMLPESELKRLEDLAHKWEAIPPHWKDDMERKARLIWGGRI